MKHDHESFTKCCPVCGLAPKLPFNSLTPWGMEYLSHRLAPCACGGAPVLIQGGDPTTYRYYCQNSIAGNPCDVTTREYDNHSEAVYAWNCIQIDKGFDQSKLHPLNRTLSNRSNR